MYKKKRVAPKQKKTTVNTKYKTGAKKPKRIITRDNIIPASMPMSQKFLFKYEDITTTTLVLSNQPVISSPFAVNNLNQLDSIPGQQFPSGYSNWSRFYTNFLVHYVKMNVEFINNSQNAIYAVVAFRPIANENVVNSWNAWRNLDSNSSPNKQVLMTAKGGAKDQCKISLGCNLGKLIGKPDAFNALTDFAGRTVGNPLNPAISIEAVIAALSGTSAFINANITVKVSIECIATLYQLRTQFNGSSV